MARHKKNKRTENKPVVVDLFSGVGGLSLGAARAGFRVAAAVDTDPISLATHGRNFRTTVHIDRTVRTLTARELLTISHLKSGEVDGLIGGPPCQGFSIMGHRSSEDRRNNLFAHFFRLVADVKPKFYIVENVPGILATDYARVRTRALALIERSYVALDPITVTASDFGVPTKRTRVFFIGYRNDVSEQLATTSFAPPAREKVVVREALRGLPIKISDEWQTEEQGWRPLGDPTPTPYLRKAAGHIPDGMGDDRAVERYLERGQVSGCLGTIHEKKVISRFERLEPGERDPVSKAMRLDPSGLCPTLRAGTGVERGSYQAVRPIHHREARVITPREAARLQGFPDWFLFHPTKWHSFRQIGNSVSPLVAEVLLKRIAVNLIA